MSCHAVHIKRYWPTAVRLAIATAVFSVGFTDVASAYVGPSFMQIPNVTGDWKGAQHKNWLKIEANYWKGRGMGLGGGFGRSPMYFSGPVGPRKGAGTLVIAIAKNNPVLPQLMDRCANKTPMAELAYAESSDLARGPREMGPRPADMPTYFEYKLKDATFSDCPVVADAPEQAIVVSFNDIEVLNWQREETRVPLKVEPAKYQLAPPSSKTKSFVLTWFAYAHDVSDNQCPVMNAKPTDDDYYALMSKEDADKERATLKDKGINYQNGQMGLRGPNKLNVALLPGIVKDPGHAAPQTTVARGLNLDGNDGTGKPPAGICQHKNYVSEDGRTGIDNQLYTVQGCIPSFMGHKGFVLQFANNQMHDGLLSMLIQITGIDNEQNDKSVDVTLFYSHDPMSKNASGSLIAPDYTFRLTNNADFAHYTRRVHGRIVNGVVITDPVKELQMNLGQYGMPMELKLTNAQMRLEFMPDRTIKGVLGGYADWRLMETRFSTSAVELYMGFQIPAMYNAVKRAADGMKDPITGECNGISTAYDIEGIPAYIAPAAPPDGKDKLGQAPQAPQAPVQPPRAPPAP